MGEQGKGKPLFKPPGWASAVTAILLKDLRQYYSKAPVISWGLLFPMTLVILLGYSYTGMGAWRVVPGLIAVSLLFASTSMSQVAVSFDKMNWGIDLLIHSPIPGSAIVVAKALGGVVVGLAGSIASIGVLYLIVGAVPVIHPLYLIAGLVLGSLTFSFMTVGIAVIFNPVEGVAVLNLVRFSMIFLGGLFPATIMPDYLKTLSLALPMCYISDLIRYGTYNLYEYTDPLTALIASVIYLAVVAVVSSKVALDFLIP
ncbi:ABC transporter permease [Thermogladius sp. 4427co]|uniref:ABC transporter permease n=1 Tax=Thermogladius sp. 4427co TaxID=3450718 RepID=UPI003F7AC697